MDVLFLVSPYIGKQEQFEAYINSRPFQESKNTLENGEIAIFNSLTNIPVQISISLFKNTSQTETVPSNHTHNWNLFMTNTVAIISESIILK